MKYIRKITVGIACGLLPVLLLGFGLSFSLYQVFGKPDRLKSALAESGIYDSAASSFVSELQKGDAPAANGQGVSSNDIPVDQPKVQEAITSAFPGSSLKPQAEGVIDSTYSWIRGDSKELKLSVSLEGNKQNLLANLQHYAKERAAGLPPCQKIPMEDPGAFNATCIPPGVTPDIAADQATAKLKQGDFFKQSTIDISSFKDEKGQTLDQRLSKVPTFYDWWVKSTWIGAILIPILMATIIFLMRPWQSGLRRAAKISLPIGVSSIILALLSLFLVGKAADSVAKTTGNTSSVQTTAIEVVRLLAHDLRGWWLGYGIMLVVLSIAALVTLKILSKKEKQAPHHESPGNNQSSVPPVN